MECAAATASCDVVILMSGLLMRQTHKKEPSTYCQTAIATDKTLYSSLSAFVPCPGCCSDEEGLPGCPCMSLCVAMATRYFPTLFILLCLSSVTLLLLTLLPSVAPSVSFSSSSTPPPWPSPSCGRGESWAVRLHAGPHYEEEDGEQVALELSVVANRVQKFMNIFC